MLFSTVLETQGTLPCSQEPIRISTLYGVRRIHTLISHFLEIRFNIILRLDVCLSVHRCICVEKKNQLDATEWFIALIICSTFFGHFYAHHQELETICVLLPPMVCSALAAGCRMAGEGQQAMRSG